MSNNKNARKKKSKMVRVGYFVLFLPPVVIHMCINFAAKNGSSLRKNAARVIFITHLITHQRRRRRRRNRRKKEDKKKW